MKLSQFKGTNIRKRFQFVNGELQEILVKEQTMGDINFYSLDIDRLEIINNEVISKMDDNDSNELLMFKVIPYITDVECDITFNEFMSMMNSPSKAFMAFAGEIVASINEMFNTIGELSEIVSATSELSNVIITEEKGVVNTEFEQIEGKIESDSKEADLDTEALLDSLYEQLGKTSNREDRKKLIKRIADLQKS